MFDLTYFFIPVSFSDLYSFFPAVSLSSSSGDVLQQRVSTSCSGTVPSSSVFGSLPGRSGPSHQQAEGCVEVRELCADMVTNVLFFFFNASTHFNGDPVFCSGACITRRRPPASCWWPGWSLLSNRWVCQRCVRFWCVHFCCRRSYKTKHWISITHSSLFCPLNTNFMAFNFAHILWWADKAKLGTHTVTSGGNPRHDYHTSMNK